MSAGVEVSECYSIDQGTAGPRGLSLRRTECHLASQGDITESLTHGDAWASLRTGFRTRAWYALYSRARQERKVYERLRDLDFETYLPFVTRERRWQHRTATVEWPLFPGYVFVRVRADTLPEVLDVAGVLTVVRHDGIPAPIREKVIEDLRRLARLARETGTLPRPAPLIRRGRPVRIVSGPLEGVEGVVVEPKGGGRVLFELGVDVIGQGLKLEVEASILRVDEAMK